MSLWGVVVDDNRVIKEQEYLSSKTAGQALVRMKERRTVSLRGQIFLYFFDRSQKNRKPFADTFFDFPERWGLFYGTVKLIHLTMDNFKGGWVYEVVRYQKVKES